MFPLFQQSPTLVCEFERETEQVEDKDLTTVTFTLFTNRASRKASATSRHTRDEKGVYKYALILMGKGILLSLVNGQEWTFGKNEELATYQSWKSSSDMVSINMPSNCFPPTFEFNFQAFSLFPKWFVFVLKQTVSSCVFVRLSHSVRLSASVVHFIHH